MRLLSPSTLHACGHDWSLGEQSRFWLRVHVHDADEADCWLWRGCLYPNGYGSVRIPMEGRTGLAHRVAYELLVGPIPEGLTLDHICRIRYCVSPFHLEPCERGENVLRGIGPTAENARKESCPKCGGPFVRDSQGHRYCRPCAKQRRRERRLATAA